MKGFLLFFADHQVEYINGFLKALLFCFVVNRCTGNPQNLHPSKITVYMVFSTAGVKCLT